MSNPTTIGALRDLENIERDLDKSWEGDELRLTEVIVIDAASETKLVRRIDIRFLPAAMFLFLINFLDRSNIGNARILNSDTGDSLVQTAHLKNQQYLSALMAFYVSYTLFEVPSNYMLKRFQPNRWIAFLTMGWGAMTMIFGTVSNFSGVIAVRFFLGAFEAGLFPGLVYWITFWYKQDERALRISLVEAVATLGGAFGGVLAFGVGHMNKLRGLQGWRWLFILEGTPSCICAILVYFMFPNFPETAGWLSEGERRLATERIKGVASLGHAKITWDDAKATLKDWRLYLHYFSFIAFNIAFSSISLFSPTIVSGLGFEGLDAQLFTVPPYAIAFVVTVFLAWQTEKRGLRSWACFGCLVISGIAFLVQGALPPHAFKARYGFLCIAVSFSFPAGPLLLSWLTANLRNTGASTLAIPMNVSVGQIGQIAGVYIFKTSEAPAYPTGLFTCGAFLLMGSVDVLLLRLIYTRRNRRLGLGERKWQL